MKNQEFFENYGSEKWAVEENLCFMLQEFWEQVREHGGCEKLPTQMPINPVGFVKKFMRDDTLVEVEYAEQSKMNGLAKRVVDAHFVNGVQGYQPAELRVPEEFVDADVREL